MSYLGKYGFKLIGNGYDIIPIRKGFKYPKGLSGWQNIKATEKELTKWLGSGFVDGGVGVLAERTPGVDIDVHDNEIVQKMVAFTEQLLGKSLKRVGLPPKVLLPYRTDNPFTKVSSSTYEEFLGDHHKVEILGKGQQYIAFSTHPDTKQPYTWENAISLSNTRYEDLPLITEEQAEEIVAYFESIIPEDWEKVQETERSKAPVENAFENYKRPLDISLKKIKDSLDRLDPDVSYDQWFRVGMALYHQFNGDAEGLSLWDEWSARGGKYRDGEPKLKWPSFEVNLKNTNPITFSSVLRLTKEKEKTNSKGFKWSHATETMSKLGEIQWTVKDFIESNTTGLFFGDPGCYKSFLAMDIALHCSTGKDWHGSKVDQGLVLYIAGEGHGGLARRLCAWTLHHKLDMTNHPFYFSQQAADIYNKETAKQVTDSINSMIESEGQPKIIVIDTLARNFGPGDENNTSDMNVFIDHVDRYLREPYGCTVLIVHHTGHHNKQRARGAMALKGGVDFEYRIEKESSLLAKVSCTKMKDAEEPENIFFQGEKVLIDMTEDEEISSLVFEKTSAPVEEEKPLKGKQKAIYDLLNEIMEDQESVQRDAFKEVCVQQGAVRDTKDFRKILHELRKKDLVEEVDEDIKIIDPFSK